MRTDNPRCRYRPVLRSNPERADPTAASPVGGKLLQRSALGIATLAHNEQVAARLGDISRNDGIAVCQAHAPDAAAGAIRGADILLVEANRLALAAHQDDILSTTGLAHRDQFVSLLELHRNQPVRTHSSELFEPNALDIPLARHQDEVAVPAE